MAAKWHISKAFQSIKNMKRPNMSNHKFVNFEQFLLKDTVARLKLV